MQFACTALDIYSKVLTICDELVRACTVCKVQHVKNIILEIQLKYAWNIP